MLMSLKKMNFKLCPILIVSILLIGKISFAQISIDSIIDKHLAVTGLINLPDGFSSFSMDGEIMQNNMAFPIKIKGVNPDLFRMDMTFNKLDFVQVSNGRRKWEYNPMTDSITSSENTAHMARNFEEHWCGALIKYKNGKAKARLMGTSTVDDIEVYKIELTHNDQKLVYYIDQLSYLIVRIDDDFVENKITYYSDYRKVDSYYLPFAMTGYENGVPIMSMKFANLKLNIDIPEETFSKPN
jgi:outer membrane lipoprotein-sorting protein